jgi:CRP-like cAMP-binding protein
MDHNDSIHEIIENAIEHKSAFGDLLTTQEKQVFIDYGVIHSAVKDEVLCKQGDNDRRVFIIIIGEVEISEGSGKSKVVLTHLKRGEVFGEIGALFEPVRISNVEATKPSVFLIIPGAVFERVITGRVELYSAILERYKDRLSETALRSVDLFRRLDKNSIRPLIEASSMIGVPANQIIINEGESGDYFYIMARGTARVSHTIGKNNINLALIHPGDYFGEWSVLTGAPRAATVSAIDRVDLLRIERSAMLNFIQSQPDVAGRLDLVAHNRHDSIPGSASADSAEELTQWLKNLEDVMEQGLKE